MKQLISRGLQLANSGSARATYILLGGNILDSVLSFLFTLITFRLLSTAGFGIFSALNNFIFTTVLVLDMGIGAALLHFIPAHSKPFRYVISALILRAVTALMVAVLVIILSPALARHLFAGSGAVPVLLAGAAIATVSIFDVVVFILQGYGRFWESVAVSNLFTAARLVVAAVFLVFGFQYSVAWAVAVSFLGPLPAIIAALLRLKLPFSSGLPHRSIFSAVARFGGWLGLYKISSTISTRLDIQMLLLYLGASSTGIYSVAARLANFYPVIIASLFAVLASRLSRSEKFSSAAVFLGKSLAGIIVLSVCMLIAAVLAYPFVTILFGREAAAAASIFRYLTLAYIPLLYATLPLSVIVYLLRSPRIAGIMGIMQVAVVFACNIIFIPRLGSYGPAVSLGVANTLVLLSSSVIVIRKWKSES